MKVTVNAQGDVELNIDNGEGLSRNAIDLIHALQADARKVAEDTQRAMAGKPKPGTGRLNTLQYATWEFLCENDCAQGVTVAAMARWMNINDAKASKRMSTIAKMGYAERIGKGRYRALTPNENK